MNNDRTLWLPATIVCAADHGSYIVKVIGGAEYRWGQDHICECHPDAVKPDTHPKVEVAGQPVTTPSTSEAVQLQQAPTAPVVQPSVAPTTPKQAAAWSSTAATHIQLKAPATADVQPPPAELLSHLTNLVVSVRHHNTLLSKCKYQPQWCDSMSKCTHTQWIKI